MHYIRNILDEDIIKYIEEHEETCHKNEIVPIEHYNTSPMYQYNGEFDIQLLINNITESVADPMILYHYHKIKDYKRVITMHFSSTNDLFRNRVNETVAFTKNYYIRYSKKESSDVKVISTSQALRFNPFLMTPNELIINDYIPTFREWGAIFNICNTHSNIKNVRLLFNNYSHLTSSERKDVYLACPNNDYDEDYRKMIETMKNAYSMYRDIKVPRIITNIKILRDSKKLFPGLSIAYDNSVCTSIKLSKDKYAIIIPNKIFGIDSYMEYFITTSSSPYFTGA